MPPQQPSFVADAVGPLGSFPVCNSMVDMRSLVPVEGDLFVVAASTVAEAGFVWARGLWLADSLFGILAVVGLAQSIVVVGTPRDWVDWCSKT